jgi:hypothetical protein
MVCYDGGTDDCFSPILLKTVGYPKLPDDWLMKTPFWHAAGLNPRDISAHPITRLPSPPPRSASHF